MTRVAPIIIWGTGPNSSKSHVCLALLRILVRQGLSPVPFKAITAVEPDRWQQSNDAIGPIPHHVSAANTVWRPEMSPVTVELETDTGYGGGHLKIAEEHRGYVPMLTSDTLDGHDLSDSQRVAASLAIEQSVVQLWDEGHNLIIEGAGSPVDARLDMANIPIAESIPDARIVLSVYCWNGGSAAAVVGTLECLPTPIRKRVIGFVFNRAKSPEAADYWASIVSQKTGLPLLGQVGDLSKVTSADHLETFTEMADPWADSLELESDLSWLKQ